MLLTDSEIKKVHDADLYLDFYEVARAIESAVLEKLKAQEPVGYMVQNDGKCMGFLPTNEKNTVPVFTNPLPPADVVRDPRVAELEAVLRECREVFAEHCAAYLGHESNVKEAIAKIDEVLK